LIKSVPTTPKTPAYFLADLYTFKWSEFDLRLPLISASAVALCLFVGIALGHPGGALVSAGGALTIGFGANQRISDSRLLPMIFAIFAMSSATLAGSLVGHRGFELIIASAVSAAIYGFLTMRDAGLAWVGQQASIALFVSSAFHADLKLSAIRAGLIALGGVIQLLLSTIGMRLIPELRKDLFNLPPNYYASLYDQRLDLLARLRSLPKALPTSTHREAIIYAARLILTVSLASELYRQLGIQSGYWIPMTALLVQKPAFFETLTRGLQRIGGTLAGAYLATLLAVHVPFTPWHLALLTTFFAFWCFAFSPVNYALFSICITSFIVFLLSLNATPTPEIAHRRAWCTVAGSLVAFAIHVDALRRHRKQASAS
jgi:Fusaric acid resistance protein-like